MLIHDFALNEIEVKDDYLVNAFRLEQDYLLSLEADRLLAGFYEVAGKVPKQEHYPGNWEEADLAGHTLGHYLTALAQAYASTKDKRFLERLEYSINSLKECQLESGYLSAFKEEFFDSLEKRKQSVIPWYTMHKVLSGLIKVYQLAELPTALTLAIQLGNWIVNRVNRWDEATRQTVLAAEDGGMNDCLYELYKESGRLEFMLAAEKFDETVLFHQILAGNDVLQGKNANATIPKFLGALNRYQTVGEDQQFYLETARSFFDIVVENHTYVTGGNSELEHFGTPKMLASARTNCNCETCNSYNMLKLARKLFQLTGEKKYLDYYEGTFWNSIIASQNPKTGMSMYFHPMETGYFKVFSQPYDSFWCCTGTGMENFTKLNDSIYYKREDVIYVGMYISSCLQDGLFGVRVNMEADLPVNPTVRVVVEKSSEGESRIAFRCPVWSKNGISVVRKGKNLKTEERGGFVYVSLEKGTTELEVVFTPEVEIHSLPDNPNVVAFSYGPLVLSAGLGTENMTAGVAGANVMVATKEVKMKDTLEIRKGSLEEWRKNPNQALVRQGNELVFRLSGTDEDKKLVFTPHYARFEERYGIYWKLVKRKKQDAGMPEKKDMIGKKDIVEKKQKNTPLMVALSAIVVLLLLVTGFFVALEVSDSFRSQVFGRFDKQNETKPQEIVTDATSTPRPDDTSLEAEKEGTVMVTEPKEEYIYMPNLEQESANANAVLLHGFSAFVEQIGGKQYLTFTNGKYKVSYKNDIPSQESALPVCEVIISNGTETKTFYWDYYMEPGNVAALCPKVGDYCKNGKEQLVFTLKEHSKSEADTLRIVAGNPILEYYVISPTAALNNLITVNAYLDAGRAIIADLSSDNRNYYISLPKCNIEIAKEVYPVKADSKLTYEIDENKITVQSFVELGDGHYIGRIRGSLTYSSRDVFRLSSSSFYVFAEDDFCDDNSMGIAEPVTEQELELTRIPVVGDGGERLLVRAREDIAKHTYQMNQFQLDENGFLAYYENGVKKSLVGVDVSKWQYDIDWRKVANAGVDYAIIRLGYRGTAAAGNCAMDGYFETNMKGALEAGLQVGVYYFTQAVTVEEAIAEANIVIEALKNYNVTFPVVYDTEYAEDARANVLTNAERTACAKAFCDTILAAGYTPVVYSSTNWCVLDLDLEGLQNYDFWYAYYGNPEDVYFPYQFTMWQYTDNGKVDGIPTAVDLNISLVDYSTR